MPTNKIVVSDIDGTLIQSALRNELVWDLLTKSGADIYLITARAESARQATESELKQLAISFDKLIMKPSESLDSAEFKRDALLNLMKDYEVLFAVENHLASLEAYRTTGVKAIHPGDVKAQQSTKLDPAELKGANLSKVEQRTNSIEFEVREDSDGMTFSGYAALFDSPSEPLPFIETIQRGAFRGSLRSRQDIKFLWNHDAGEILGSTRAKTLTLVEDERGLKVEGSLPNTSRGRDVAELLRRGDVDAMSFGFSVPSGGDKWSTDGSQRTLKSVRLHEVSLVSWPAYTATAGTVSVRKYEKLAERANVDPGTLAEALTKIEDGLDITTDEKEILSRVIGSLAPQPEAVTEVLPVYDLTMLALKKAKLDLLTKGY